MSAGRTWPEGVPELPKGIPDVWTRVILFPDGDGFAWSRLLGFLRTSDVALVAEKAEDGFNPSVIRHGPTIIYVNKPARRLGILPDSEQETKYER